MQTVFDLCQPRDDVLKGHMKDEEFAADLTSVVRPKGKKVKEYADPALFFRYTYPTQGLKSLLEAVCRRLSGKGGELNSVIRLDTQYGGGKTHSLIALVHAVGGMKGVKKVKEFVDPKLLPKGKVRIAALDGENADPANGLRLEGRLKAHSLWGEMAYRLAGKAGFERVKRSDEKHVAPGAETIAELFGGEPTLILIDEVSAYLRKVAKVYPDAANQFTAFIHALIKAVSSTPQAALVLTLAVGARDQEASDAYKAEHQLAVQVFEEAESIVSRKLLQLNPTEESETVEVLRRRLFESIDAAKAKSVVKAYADLWDRNKESLPPDAFSPETRDQFRRGYPFHPETLNVLMEKVSSLSTFQRTRGMLRLLARTVRDLWDKKPADALAIHPHHINPEVSAIRDEITTRLGQGAFTPALASDVASVPGRDPAIAQRLDQDYPGQPTAASYVARTIFMNTLAFGDAAQGVTSDHLRYSVCSPMIEPSFVEGARKRFAQESLYLDDRPGAPMRFRVEPNLTQIVNRAMKDMDPDELRDELNSKVKDLFRVRSGDFELIPFPAGPYEIPDDVGQGRPYLIVLNYDAFTASETPSELPNELVRMATRKGTEEKLRELQNNLVFVVADQRSVENMKAAVRRRLGLAALKDGPQWGDLADYQQRRIKEDSARTSFDIAEAILQCYRHLFYPSSSPIGGSEAKLGHTIIELQNASDSPGNGQQHIKRALRAQKKLLAASDTPDAPAFVRDQTPLKTAGEISTMALRNEFRRAPNLSILLDDNPLIRCITLGIKLKVFIYREGDIVWGPGDPAPMIRISENAYVHTMRNAKKQGLWPRKEKEGPKPTPKPGTQTAMPVPGELPTGQKLKAEGSLKQALTELFEKARKAEVGALGRLSMRFFNHRDAWPVHQAVATYRDADASADMAITIEADGIETLELTFRGTFEKANMVKSLVERPLQAANSTSFEGGYALTFKKPLSTKSGAAEAFIKAMTKYGGGEAYVEAHAAPTEES